MDETDFYDSWEAYYATLEMIKATKGKCPDGGPKTFLPSPDEIAQRANDVLWMQQMGFGNRVIESVMQWDHPSIDWIDHQINVKKRTAAEITRRIKPLLISKEYRKDDD